MAIAVLFGILAEFCHKSSQSRRQSSDNTRPRHSRACSCPRLSSRAWCPLGRAALREAAPITSALTQPPPAPTPCSGWGELGGDSCPVPKFWLCLLLLHLGMHLSDWWTNLCLPVGLWFWFAQRHEAGHFKIICLISVFVFFFFKHENFSVKGSRRSTVAPVHKGGFSVRPESCRVHSDRPLIGVARPFGERNFCQAECVCYMWDGPDLWWLDK